MRKESGFSIIEALVVLVFIIILGTLAAFSLNSYRRQVKTEDAAGCVFSIMKQARIQSITRRQFYAVVINVGPAQSLKVNANPTATLMLPFPENSVSLVDMGTLMVDDEVISLTKKLPIDIVINASSGLPAATAFPIPEQNFVPAAFTSNSYICYFDPGGRAVNNPEGTGTQVYTTLYFSSFDINTAKASGLLRAVTLYGATGGVKFWKFMPPGTWI